MSATTQSDRAAVWSREGILELEPVPASLRPDVCVVGAGIAGLTTAYRLLARGRSVLVLDREGVGHGETSRSTAHVSFALDDRFTELERWHGGAGARLAYESHRAGLEFIDRVVRDEGIECGFRRLPGYLFASERDDLRLLEREFAAARRADVEVVFRQEEVRGALFDGPCLEFHRQGQLDPMAYLAGLDRAVRQNGGHVAGPAQVVAAGGGDPAWVELSDGTRIEAGCVVMASNVPFHGRVAMHTKQAAFRTFVIAMPISEYAAPDGLVWDTSDPYHYVRTFTPKGASSPLLLIGGADEKTGQPSERDPFRALFEWATAHFRVEGTVAHAWSGQVIEPADGLGYAGRAPGEGENLYLVTGDSGNGITHASLSALLLDALISGEEHPWEQLYSPSRKATRGAIRWARENLNAAAQLGDWIAPGDEAGGGELERGEAAVTREGLHRIARHRDEAGEIHAFSARCPHLGCSVRWNDIEQTWDCPCHGSRFDPIDGRVLNGPSTAPLTPASEISPARRRRERPPRREEPPRPR